MEEALKKGREKRGDRGDGAEGEITEEDIEAMLSDMMSSLLTKDMLYEPLRDLAQMVTWL